MLVAESHLEPLYHGSAKLTAESFRVVVKMLKQAGIAIPLPPTTRAATIPVRAPVYESVSLPREPYNQYSRAPEYNYRHFEPTQTPKTQARQEGEPSFWSLLVGVAVLAGVRLLFG
jgi:hypothetical protein